MAESKRFVCELSFSLPSNDTLAHTEIIQKIMPAIRAVETAAKEAQIELTMSNKIMSSPTNRGPRKTPQSASMITPGTAKIESDVKAPPKPAHLDRGSGLNKA